MWVSEEFYDFAKTKSNEFEKLTGVKITDTKATTLIAREYKIGKKMMSWDIL